MKKHELKELAAEAMDERERELCDARDTDFGPTGCGECEVARDLEYANLTIAEDRRIFQALKENNADEVSCLNRMLSSLYDELSALRGICAKRLTEIERLQKQVYSMRSCINCLHENDGIGCDECDDKKIKWEAEE